MMRGLVLFAAPLASARIWWLPDAPVGTTASALPFPPKIERMYEGQKAAVARAAKGAPALSDAATPLLLAYLNASSFRQALTTCCSKSGLASQTPHALLDKLRAIMYASELVHNFDNIRGFETDVTIPIGAHNATHYFPTTWMLRYLEYYGPRYQPEQGFPASPEGVAEEGVFRLASYEGPYDEPSSFGAASSRLHYIALNMLRVDVGNPDFGNVTAVFSPAFWEDAIVAAPADSGIYTMFCNKTYSKIPGSLHPGGFGPNVSCDAGDITAGVYGQMDHVLLNNARFWPNVSDTLLRYFERSHGDGGDAAHNVTSHELLTYIEPNILANALYREGPGRAIKMLVGSFAPLFGTARGQMLRKWAADQQIVLTWAIGTGLVGEHHFHSGSTFSGHLRVLDVTKSAKLVNASTDAADAHAFDQWWRDVAAARDLRSGGLPQARVWELWGRHSTVVPESATLAMPRAGDCSDWTECLGRAQGGECVCRVYEPI